ANELLLSRSRLTSALRPVLQVILALLVLGAAAGCGAFSGISVQRATSIFQIIDFASNLIEAGMVLSLFLFARALRVKWHSWVAGVELGLGVSASIDLIIAALGAGWWNSAFLGFDVSLVTGFSSLRCV